MLRVGLVVSYCSVSWFFFLSHLCTFLRLWWDLIFENICYLLQMFVSYLLFFPLQFSLTMLKGLQFSTISNLLAIQIAPEWKTIWLIVKN